ncbi:MAG: hypothetical protein ABSA46_00770, partial [Thermodesulfovibrionales bacterium]
MVTAVFSGLSLHLYEHEATASPTATGVLSPVPDRSIRLAGDPLCLRAFSPKLAGRGPPLTDCSKIL